MPIYERSVSLSFFLVLIALTTPIAPAQSPQPYPNAVTDRLSYQETPMLPPSKNVLFTDPDFGSSMVRATDSTTNFRVPGTALRTEGSGEANEWSADTSKFYVIGAGGYDFAFSFNPSTMEVSSLAGATPGKGLLLPLDPVHRSVS